MFNFFKKKPIEPPLAEAITPEPVVEKQIQIDDIAIHTMPERFRHQPIRANNAKTTGLLIIGGGVIFLILASVGVYYFLFKQPAVIVTEEPIVTATPTASPAQSEVVQSTPAPGTLTEPTPEPTISPADTSFATSTATSTPETVEQGLTVGLTPALDSDNDGLTDTEEILLGTATSTPDTDGDGYLDGAEILNFYDPASTGKLTANPAIALYENKTFNYSVLYPSAWQASANGGDDSMMFKSADNQFFQIIVQPNTAKQSLDEWYMDQLDVTTVNESDRLSGANWQGLKSADGLTLYLMDANQKNIFTLAYNPGESNLLSYINIFDLMIRSFVLKE